MKILIDENLPKKLKFDFGPKYQVFTVKDMGWNGKKNSELLGLMTLKGFNIFITIDKNLRYQQNLDRFPFTTFLLNAKDNKHQTLQPLIIKLKDFLTKDLKTGLIEISLQPKIFGKRQK